MDAGSSVWSAGTVLEVDYSVEDKARQLLPHREWAGTAGRVPYRVELDSGKMVLVHRDEHWLVRELALQADGRRQEDHSHQEVDDDDYAHGECDHEHGHMDHCSHEHDHADRELGYQDHVHLH